MNRRNVLIGLGGVVAGGGALLGTGAFTTVEAQRTVTVNTAGDASALLGLEPNTDLGSNIVDTEDGLLVIDFETTHADGVNLDALTTVGEVDTDGEVVTTEALTIANNGTQTVDISFDITFDEAHSGLTQDNEGDVLKLWTDTGGDGTIDGGSFGNLVEHELEGLGAGETVQVALQIDTDELDTTDVDTSAPLFEPEATITAEAQ